MDMAAFAMGATAFGAGAGVSAVSVSADEVDPDEADAGAVAGATAVVGMDATSGFASDFPESKPSFGAGVASGGGGAEEGALSP